MWDHTHLRNAKEGDDFHPSWPAPEAALLTLSLDLAAFSASAAVLHKCSYSASVCCAVPSVRDC